MNKNKILQIIHEELNNKEGLLFEGMSYRRGGGYRNNQLLEIYDGNGKLLLTEGVIDDVQSVLDWAGFIPGIGDALDAINAIIYMVRKKWVLGALSLVAVIPVVGSVIATPFKALHKLVGSLLGNILQKASRKFSEKITYDVHRTLTDNEELIKRDVKGLYKSQKENNEIMIPGINEPYESPTDPEIYIDTHKFSIEQSIIKIIEYLKSNKFIF